jgi:K+-sensing histidine kinase KdpD
MNPNFSKNLANTIKTILITSKASESKLVINKEQVDIIELTQQAQEQIDINYASKPHAIGIHDHREEKALVYADKYLIENVMHNLMENAVKYSDKEANVEVNIKQDEHFTIISVSDHGVGIDKKYQKKIFEQFYRIPATHHKSGYGIAILKFEHQFEHHQGVDTQIRQRRFRNNGSGIGGKALVEKFADQFYRFHGGRF